MKKVIQSTMMACFALICMCLASCNDDAIAETSPSNETGQPFRLTATQETSSRLELGQDGLTVTWEPGDQLVLVMKNRSIVPIYMNAELTAPSTSATFVSETGVPAGEYYVFYNYNDELVYSHHAFSSIDDINNADKLVLWGELTVTNGATSATIALQHLYAKVRVELQNVPSGNTWYYIGMYASKSGFPVNKKFDQTGMIDVDYVYDNNSWNYTYKASKRKYHHIRFGLYNMKNAYTDETGVYYPSNKSEIEKNAALILPADVSDGTLYFYILDGNDCYEIPKSDIKFDAGKSYKVVLDMASATKTTLSSTQITLPGNSSSDTFYQLTSPEDCRHAAYRGRHYNQYILMNDIDFQNNTFLPLSTSYFYGNEKTLKNVSVEWEDEDYVGLIKYEFNGMSMGEDGRPNYIYSMNPLNYGCTITNLTLENIQIKGHSYVGALSAANVKAENCKIQGTSSVIGQGDYVGGLVGLNRFNCDGINNLKISDSSIESCTIKGNNYVGGIVGQYNDIHNNFNLYLNSSLRLLKSCSSAATIEATGDYVGGIFGQIGNYTSVEFGSEDYTLSLYGCINTGSVKGKDYVGGIGGAFSIYNNSSVKDKVVVMQSANEGNVEGANNVGGILGTNLATINLCYSIGDYSATGNNLGGIVGITNEAAVSNYITNCYSMANLTTSTGGYAGGIIGQKYEYMGSVDIENCYFAGTNTTNCGIIGYSGGNVNITNCLTTLSSFGDTTAKQANWDVNGDGVVDANDVIPTIVTNSLNQVTSIRNNRSVINGDNAYSDDTWQGYPYDCVKFAAGLSGSVTAPGFGTEIVY